MAQTPFKAKQEFRRAIGKDVKTLSRAVKQMVAVRSSMDNEAYTVVLKVSGDVNK